MALRFFESEIQAKLYAQSRIRPPIHLIEHILNFLKEKVEGDKLQNAVDLGCGSGQCTFLLAPYFQNVLGTDISPVQIREAENERLKRGLENVQLKICPGETIPVPDKFVQLITSCGAAQYMDLEKVFAEGRRVLVPGGVMAFLASGLPGYTYKLDEVKDQQFQVLYKEVERRCHKYMVEQFRKILEHQFEHTIVPYNDLTRGSGYLTEREVSLKTILDVTQSLSFYQTLVQVEGQEAGNELIATFKKRTEEILSSSGTLLEELPVFHERFSFYFVMARV